MAKIRSELDILKEQGLPDAPEDTSPASDDAKQAMKDYRLALWNFQQAWSDLETYLGLSRSAEEEFGITRKLTNICDLAENIRRRALDLGSYPTCFTRNGSEAIFYSAIAESANEAYYSRCQAIDDLEVRLGRVSPPMGKTTLGTLRLHEGGLNKGHLLELHVDIAWADVDARLSGKQVVSRFISREIAEEAVWRAIQLHLDKIHRAPDGTRLKIPIHETKPIGYVKRRGSNPRPTSEGIIRIKKDSRHPLGFQVITAELGQ